MVKSPSRRDLIKTILTLSMSASLEGKTKEKQSRRSPAKLTSVVDLTGEESISEGKLQSEIDKASIAATSLGSVIEIRLPPGKIKVSRTIFLRSHVSLVGRGECTELDAGDVQGLTVIIAHMVSGTKLSDISIVGSGFGNQPKNGQIINFNEVSTAGCGIVLSAASEVIVERVKVTNCGGLSGVKPMNGVAGIWLTNGCKRVTVRRCLVTRCRNGINEDNFFGLEPQSNQILNNIVRSCRFGIALDSGASSTKTTVRSNNVAYCLHSGIDLNKANNCIIENNFIVQCGVERGNSGIHVYGSKNIKSTSTLIIGNTVRGGHGSGIKVSENSSDLRIIGNEVSLNRKFGIFLTDKCWNVAVIGNVLSQNGLGGIKVLQSCGIHISHRDGVIEVSDNKYYKNSGRAFDIRTGIKVVGGDLSADAGNEAGAVRRLATAACQTQSRI